MGGEAQEITDKIEGQRQLIFHFTQKRDALRRANDERALRVQRLRAETERAESAVTEQRTKCDLVRAVLRERKRANRLSVENGWRRMEMERYAKVSEGLERQFEEG